MVYEISESLKVVFQAIEDRCSDPILYDRYELKTLLRNLSSIEQLLIARNFCKLSWNIGSLRVLAVLQTAHVLTASNYILSQENNAGLQLILNDFLEAEFELIQELFIAAHYDSSNGIRLNDIIDECLGNLYADLLQNPKLNDLKYLQTVTKHMPADFIVGLMQRHIRIVLDLHKSNTKSAFANFAIWINEGVDEIEFTKEIYSKLLQHSQPEAISYLFKLSTAESFKEWKFYLILLQTIACKCAQESTLVIKKYFKARLVQIAATPSREAMLHLLLSIRAATATTMDIDKNITAYADWYKQNISDMKFIFKVEEFQAIIDLLQQCIPYETAEDYIEIHATYSISPPLHCGKLVQSYKSKCKMQLAKIKSKNKEGNENDNSILIEDSE
ncbi:uncharacterized protein LOC118742878 [Rhagoletis pomonella]|uniref:uncharacterized protein LOC118742878 n=1 Tax=Rhagoletis pomonella TaxID=28610 RepID=UPI0017870C0D|nr:uncharacterized protein LOC118742878 [Rhagoletis pomonella]